MRYVYVDEAGTSAKEPVSVVVAVIVHPDTQWASIQAEISRLLDMHVPPKARRGMVFHAKDVFSGHKYRSEWSVQSRLALIHDVLRIPGQLGVPICFGTQRRNFWPDELVQMLASQRVAPHDFDHMMAFMACIGEADLYLRRHTRDNEVATLVVEDENSHMRTSLKRATSALRERGLYVSPENLRSDVIHQSMEARLFGRHLKVSKIVDGTHFATKGDAPMLQLADACAFALRRWLCGERHGSDFMATLLGEARPILSDFSGPASAGTWRPVSSSSFPRFGIGAESKRGE